LLVYLHQINIYTLKKSSFFLPTLLTGISLFLLASFLVWWNISNYSQEKDRLKNELESELSVAASQVNFDVIYDSFIAIFNPNSGVLPDSIFQIDQPTNGDPISISIKKDFPDTIPTFFKDSFVSLDSSLSISIQLDSLVTNTDHSFLHELKNESSTIRYETVEYIGNQNNTDTIYSYSGHQKTESWNITSDDSLGMHVVSTLLEPRLNKDKEILAVFDKKMQELDYGIKYQIASDNEQKGFLISHTIKGLGQRIVSLDIYDFQWVVLKNIIPSILLSGLLFGLTSWTFWILMRSRKKQEQLVTLKNEFISNMTHELKTPISTVGVALEAMSTYGDSLATDKKEAYIDISKQELSRLSLLVDKVLKMASYDNNQSLMKVEKIDLKSSLEKILKSMTLHADQKNATIQFTTEENEALIHGDPIHLSNVFYNIIDNALKYSNENPKLNIGLTRRNNTFHIRFEDQGKGIPKEFLDKVFDRFFRTPENNRHNVKGHGLGLSYAKDVIEKHRGTIEIDSTINVGTTVTIKLPIEEHA